jgi:hypothetical protein
LTILEETVKAILQNQSKLERLGNKILREQTELKELVCKNQQMIVDELRAILKQTKNQEEIDFLNVNKFLFFI